MPEWVPDVLGSPFEQRTLPLGEDAEGPVVATLVRRLPGPLAFTRPLHDVDVLFVHGWSDYFFQTGLAEFWNELGARFYALDLRKYGRSLREGQTPGFVASLAEYDADIAAALDVVRPQGRGRLVLMGHSTGGLTLTLWSARHAGTASALVLDSPWLELQLGPLGRQAIAPILHARAVIDPMGGQPDVDLGFYTRAQKDLGTLPKGAQRALWRPDTGFATRPAWLDAILAGHERVAAGVDVGCPALVLLSARSTLARRWSEAMTRTDSVLVVDDIARAATRIGRSVTIERIEGAIHDVFLSAPASRDAAYTALERWLLQGALAR
ncbi:alpha/beta hydrolase [Microbacterium sp.]|uniref:alpha/beta hydrolase n=1 Tax=Microbacterium sp. TaxID=51671 RepID=UPI003221E03C